MLVWLSFLTGQEAHLLRTLVLLVARADKCGCPAWQQVELIEMPFTVITCADMLLVNLERVGFNLRNFDMTIVFKVCRTC
jgi:nucleosome binding factor SPN SPT16 subunit